jgi:hypothetical protein
MGPTIQGVRYLTCFTIGECVYIFVWLQQSRGQCTKNENLSYKIIISVFSMKSAHLSPSDQLTVQSDDLAVYRTRVRCSVSVPSFKFITCGISDHIHVMMKLFIYAKTSQRQMDLSRKLRQFIAKHTRLMY